MATVVRLTTASFMTFYATVVTVDVKGLSDADNLSVVTHIT